VEVPLKPGDLIVVPPGVNHHAYSTTKQVTLGSIHVNLKLPGGQDAFEMLVPPTHRSVKKGARLAQYLATAIDEWKPERRDGHYA